MNMTLLFIRILFILCSTIVGYQVGDVNNFNIFWASSAGFIFGICIIALESGMRGISVRGLSSAVFGLMLGLIVSRFMSTALFALFPLDRSCATSPRIF